LLVSVLCLRFSSVSLRVERSNPGNQNMFEKIPCVYILTNERNGTLYTGVTSNLTRRIFEHKNNLIEGFSKRYNIHSLVYYETAETMFSAIEREKQIKGGSRKKKLLLIEGNNPEWRDLYGEL